MATENPVSPKVIAASAGAGAGGVISTFVLWLLGVTYWHEPNGADNVAKALAAVPSPVAAIITLVIGALVAAVAGWTVTDPNRVTTSDLAQLKKLKGE